jgi:hypothetical protein
MRIQAALVSILVLSVSAALAADEPAAQTESVVRPGRVVIADSNSLSFHQNRKSDTKLLSDLDREDAETIMRINATRGTWQSYLLYTTPEMKVPTSRPGFIITLPPPSRKELERRRRLMVEAERAAADRAPQPAPEPSTAR